MLSRLSGLANTVLHELSGDGEDAGTSASNAGPEMEPGWPNGAEEEATTEDVLERLAHTERLVAQLKDLVREKDAQLQQKDAQLQGERQAAEGKLLKLKLQAKAKLAALNKRIEELTERGAASPADGMLREPASPAQEDGEPRPPGRPQEEEEATTEVLRRQLQQQEETAGQLQQQLDQAQAQLIVLREEIQERESRLEDQARQHQNELQHRMAPSAAEVEMQQNLRRLQQKLEEQEAALLGRTQVLELLQQELDASAEQSKAVLEKCQKAEAEVESLRSTLASERRESQSRAERLELELAEQKLASHRLQEEVQQVSQALSEAGAARAQLEQESQAAAQRHAEEVAQKGQEIADLQRAEQDLRSCYEALRDENAQLRQEASRPREPPSEEDASLQQGELPGKPQRPGQSQAATDAQGAGQLMPPEGKPVSEEDAAWPAAWDGAPPEDRQHEAAVEAPGAGTEPLPRESALLKESPAFTEGPAEPNQVSGAERTTEDPPQLPSGELPALEGSSPELQGPLDTRRCERGEELLSSETLVQPSPLGSSRGVSPASEGSPADILEHLSEKKHKDLSVLLLELQEAQEEMAFLKGQLPSDSHPEAEGAQLPRGPLQDSGGEGEEGLVLAPLVAVAGREDAPSPAGTSLPPCGSSAQDHGSTQESELWAKQQQQQQQEAEELHKAALEEREAEIRRLQQLLDDAGGALHTLRAERDQLLSQRGEPGALAELEEQVQRLEGALAEAEARRLSEYEGGLSQLGRLKEEVQSLSNEARSKEVKISALQKDLDEAQHGRAEQDLLAKSLGGRLQEAEQARELLAGRLEEASAKAEGLSQSLAAREQEAARLERLLSESSGRVEQLQRQAAEREEQAAEISRSLSDRLVQLSEEKLLLGKEMQSLTERLSLLLQERPTRDQGVGTTEEEAAEGAPPGSAAEETERLRKENEQVRKKLQAALVSRKELLSRVRQLERRDREEPGKPGANGLQVQGEEEEEEDSQEEPPEGRRKSDDGEARPAGQSQEARLGQLLLAKEAELQAALGEKDSTTASLRAAVAELQQSLQERDLRIGALQAELEAWTSAPERQPSVGQSDAADPRVQEASGPVVPLVPLGEEPPRAASEERVSALEEEREQLQKKLQEALAARKDTLKKAQEKDRHHREQLKQQKEDNALLQEQLEQQKEDNGLLQEQLEQQAREKEHLQEQLQALNESLAVASPPKPPEDLPSEGAPPVEALPDSGGEVSAEGAQASGPLPAAEDLPMEQLQADLEHLREEKRELEAQVSRLEGELANGSAAVLELQARCTELLAELERLQGACAEAEASGAGLRVELDQSRAEGARLEELRLRQAELEEGKAAASKEEIDRLNMQLKEKCDAVHGLQEQLQESQDTVQALKGQLELQRREQAQPRLHVEGAEAQRNEAAAAEGPSKAQLQRKLQAALLSRKEARRESQALREELAGTKAALEGASGRLSEAESQASQLRKEKGELLERLAVLAEERERLIAEVDRALVENQNVSGSCESLKLALEEVTREKTRWEQQAGALQHAHGQELSEWQRKHRELQEEYETLLRSYENVGGEAERIRRGAEGARQEKQQLFLRLKEAEAEKREEQARLQEAEQEMEAMREKMRRFAKAKQQKILELEEENEQLRGEARLADEGPGRAEDLREALENSQRNCESLSGQLEALLAEKETLLRQIQEGRPTSPSQAEGTGPSSRVQEEEEERVAASEALASTTALPPETAAAAEVRPEPASEPPEPAAGQQRGPSHDEINGYVRQVAHLSEQVAELEGKRKGAAEELGRVLEDLEAVGAEKRGLEELLAARGRQLEALQEKLLRAEQVGQQQAEEQAAGARRLKEALEAEKDDLEERLMNQLAQLNGSIGNYQQDAADLQSQNQQLRREAEALREALSRLEDEKRHLLRERGQAEAEKKKEREAKLKSGWKGDGQRTQVKELQELLREKQQEVRQLQKDCIRSQERSSSLERTIKALEFVQSEAKKELEAARRRLAEAGQEASRARAEQASCKVLLDDTQSEAARILAESLKAKEELQAARAQLTAQLREKEKDLHRRLEQEQSGHLQALRSLEERLEASRKEQARTEGAARELQESLRQKDQQAQQLQGSLNHTLAQLAAFTKSMSSLQDDRDRVIDESRRWERRFGDAIEKKEQEVQAGQQACAALEAQVKQAAAQVEDLQGLLASLGQDKLAQESSAQKQIQRHQEEARRLQEEREGLASQLEETGQRLSESQDRLQKQEAELGGLRGQLSRLQDSFARCQEAQEGMEARLKSQEADLQEGRFRREQLEADLQATKELTDRLHQEASTKDQKIIRLLAAQEEALAAAALEFQQKQQEERKSLEERLGRAAAEKRALETDQRGALEKAGRLTEELKSAQEESKRLKARLDSFSKSMASLQDDRDRVLQEGRQLEQCHLAALLEKDQRVQEAEAESRALKEELRGLHGRLDDLHAENAKLEAELVRYRQDLNHVLAIKDGQQKELLKNQLAHVRALEQEKAATEGQLRASEHALASVRRSLDDLQREKHSSAQEAQEGPEASLSRTESERAALREDGPVLELQARLQGKADEALELSGQLSLAQQRTRELEEEVASLQKTLAQRVQEAEAKMKEELKSLRHDAGLMRNETETAEERVAELAKDLLDMEQNLLAVTEENEDLKAQLQSFQKAMSSLQDSWDQAHEDLRATEKKYSQDLEEQRLLVQSLSLEKAHLQEEQKRLSEERDALVSELAALRRSVEEKGLLARLDLLGQQLQAKDAELLRLASELEGASGQVSSFAKALASLQGERDRLLSELDRVSQEEELRLQSAASASASLAEVPSLKSALSALQNDRDRLLVDLKNLQQQYLQVGVDTADMMRLKAQLQEQQQEMEQQRGLQEQLEQASASLQAELQQLREEKAARESEVPVLNGAQQERSLQETKRSGGPFPEKDQLQRQAAAGSPGSSRPLGGDAPSPGGDAEDLQAQLKSTLNELHQKELRVQQLNSKLSQVFEEKNSLALQLRGSSCSLRESHQRFGEVLARCQALEKRLQEEQAPRTGRESSPVDAAPGAPQERSEPPRESYTPELQELQMKLSAAQEQQSQAHEGLLQLEELLQEERDRRLAAEEAFSSARDHIRRLESSEWSHTAETSIDIPPTPEHRLLAGPSESSFSKARGGSGPRRVLRSLFCSRRRLPWLATGYLLAVHVLLLLCFTGHL